MLQPASAVLLLIAASTAVRLMFASSLGLGIDESYTVATGRQPQLGYFDHPPLAWWLAWASARLFGAEAALAVRLPFILLFAGTTWVMFALTRKLFSAPAGLWAAATLNMAPALGWTSASWVLPDGPLNLALLAGTYCATSALFGPKAAAPGWWLKAGVCGGLALLSKLHGVFLFAGVGLFLLTSRPHRYWLLNPWPYAGLVVALFMFIPVIVWNAQHDWASIAFQAGRARVQTIKPLAPLAVLAGHAAYLLPWLWIPLASVLVQAIRRGSLDEKSWLLVCLAIGPITLFTLVAWTGTRVFPHWAMPGYLLLFPLLGMGTTRAIEAGTRWVAPWLIGTATSTGIVVCAVIALAQLPWPPVAWGGGNVPRNPLEEAIDWNDLAIELKDRGLYEPGTFVAAIRWHEAGKIDYALHGALPVVCLCADPRGYGLVAPLADHLGQDALIVGRSLPIDGVERGAIARSFESVEMLAPVVIRHAGRPAFELTILRARGYRTSAPR